MPTLAKEQSYRQGILRKGAIFLLIFFAVFIFMELLSRWLATVSIAPFGETIRIDQKMMIGDSIKTGIIGIGDSVIARSFYPELFASLLAKKFSKMYEVYNLGVEGSGIEQHRAYFRHLLKRKAKPNLIIMNVSIHNLNLDNFIVDADHVVHSNFIDDNSLDYYTRCEVLNPQTTSAKTFCQFAKLSYFFRLLHFYHQQLNNSLPAILHTHKMRFINLVKGYPSVSRLGFSPNYGFLAELTMNSAEIHKAMIDVYKRALANFRLGTEGLDSIIDEIKQSSVNVVLVLIPVYQPIMRPVYDQYGLPAEQILVKSLEQYALRKKIAFINLFEQLQDPLYFQDPVHPNIYGAIKITTLIAKRIAAKDWIAPQGYLDKELFQYLKDEGGNKG